MGVKSTYIITKEVAQQALLQNVLTMTNEQLEEALEACPQSTFRNYTIVTAEELASNDKEKYPLSAIKDITQF